MKRDVEMYFIALLLLGVVFLFAFFQSGFTGTGFAVFEQSSSIDADTGTYVDTIYNSSSGAIVLNSSKLVGNYTSVPIFGNDSLEQWNNLSWGGNVPENSTLVFQVTSCLDVNCSDANFMDVSSVNNIIDLTGLNLTSPYLQYKVLLSVDNINITSPSLTSVVYSYSTIEVAEPAENVTVSLIEPTGEKESLADIPLEFSTTGENLTCWYTLDDGANNNTINNCGNTSFDVSGEGDYTLILYVNGSSLVSDSVDFSVTLPVEEETTQGEETESTIEETPVEEETTTETTQTPVIQRVTKISAPEIEAKDLSQGQSDSLTLTVSNTGTTPVSSCQFKSYSDQADWIVFSDESINLNAGDSSDFSFTINVPEDAVAGVYDMSIGVECSQTAVSQTFALDVAEKTFEFELTNVRKIRSDEVRVRYSLADISGEDQTINLNFALFDNQSTKVSEQTDVINLTANEINNFRTIVPINETIEGNLTLHTDINSQAYTSSVDEPIVLTSPGILGFVALGDIAGTGSIVILVVVVLALLVIIFVVRRIRKKSRNLKK